MKIIAITGTPGTGKSTLAKLLAKKLKFKRLNLHHHYRKISTKYDHQKKCYVIDLNKFKDLVSKESKKNNLIVDTHISHLLPRSLVNLCLILTCSDLKKLETRLKKRKYSPKKIKENLDSEIFQVCLNEAKEMRHKIIIVDTNTKMDLPKLFSKITKSL